MLASEMRRRSQLRVRSRCSSVKCVTALFFSMNSRGATVARYSKLPPSIISNFNENDHRFHRIQTHSSLYRPLCVTDPLMPKTASPVRLPTPSHRVGAVYWTRVFASIETPHPRATVLSASGATPSLHSQGTLFCSFSQNDMLHKDMSWFCL
ncbi:hypothetical protein BCV70DRAFT_60565 [Testicularia cyperi]|uniref:Uncharacterized protein n=1 Tax=Testicularia cyperi TaxID=1882483 RepID=A0A317XWH5_9BASI|nr:hypothetical protein BCV70DRAFT_60565 [Testicularia cyperi]